MSKEALQDALDYLPIGEVDLFTTIPILEETSLPTTVDTAILTQGILAHNINEILRCFEGLPPLVILMRLGQHNEALQLMAGASVQYFRASRDFEITAPPESFDNETEQTLSVTISAGSADSVTVAWAGASGDIELSLDQDAEDETLWSTTWEFNETPGELTLIFSADFGGKTLSEDYEVTINESA